MTNPTEIAHDVNALAGEIRSLARLLDAALEIQWQAPPIVAARDDTAERSKGSAPNNPTADVTLDDRRLAVRSAIRSGQQSIRLAQASVRSAATALGGALDAWEGLTE